MAVAKGVNAIMISVFATFVFWMDSTNAVLPNAIKKAYNKPCLLYTSDAADE